MSSYSYNSTYDQGEFDFDNTIGSDRLRKAIERNRKKQAKQSNPKCLGCYLDDGVFTYLGRSASQKKSERYIDAFIKKLTYGFWYDTPQTIGASKWIDQAWVMYPSEVNALLKNKELVNIYPENQGFKTFSFLAKEVLNKEKLKSSVLNELDVLITLPNETVFTKVHNYKEIISKLISNLILDKKSVGIKYHPAADNKDILDLLPLGVTLLPSNISFESLIPYLSKYYSMKDIDTHGVLQWKSKTLLSIDKLYIFEDIQFENIMDDYLYRVKSASNNLKQLEIIIDAIIKETE